LTSAAISASPFAGRISASASTLGRLVETAWLAGLHIGS